MIDLKAIKDRLNAATPGDVAVERAARIAELEKQIAELREQKESIEMDLVMQEAINEENLKSIDERDAKIAEHPGQVEQAYKEGWNSGYYAHAHGLDKTLHLTKQSDWKSSAAYALIHTGEKK